MNMFQPQITDFKLNNLEMALKPIDPVIKAPKKINMLQLSYELQTTLDIKIIIRRFSHSLKQIIPFDGVNYCHDDKKINISMGALAQHTYSCRLLLSNEYLGKISFSRNYRFRENEISQIEETLCMLIYPLRNGLIYSTAVHSCLLDPLTGINNRKAFDNTIKREVCLAQRHNSSFSLLALDIDKFKNLNDKYGHTAGDKVLKLVAQEAEKNIRDSDFIFRYGGEEFIILLGQTDMQGAILLANRICRAIAELCCEHQKQKLNTSVSIGISHFIAGDSVESLFDRADKALYRAKLQGRNQVAI